MRFSKFVTLGAIFTRALAQITVTETCSSSISDTHVTETVEDCETSTAEWETVTITSALTITSCPVCPEAPQPIDHSFTRPNRQYTTTYVTTYTAVCSTGWTQSEYTVTETYTGETLSWPSLSSRLPPGFTTTVTVCRVCGKTPITATLTVPCASRTGGFNFLNKTVSPATPYPTTHNTTVQECPGIDCKIYPSSSIYPDNPPVDKPGGASVHSMGWNILTFAITAVGALAVLL
ncbi:hypothetical protein M501DRAFT_993546 [Patellaria atrata CBS 101060]|uniref:Uncharacterized protein n=1 Tax=Patellaria atrata CBS 101060 TaxID=1346257 RepID=A0A9P4SIA5_9PEZI|nr:hypothetical protein M501DRAFT_993546 [Patellaria atrata CBS 101060]